MVDTTQDTSWATRDDWQDAWKPMIDAIGRDFGHGERSVGADEVERVAIRRYLEPLEFGCPLHIDEGVARRHGYRGLVAPFSGVTQAWSETPQWTPSDPTRYPVAEPNAPRLWNPAGAGGDRGPAPATTGLIATDIDIEYFEPVCLGDRLTRSGRKLIAVIPRESSVGRGAFVTWQSELHNQRGELVAQVRNGSLIYVPNPKPQGADVGARAARPAGPIMQALPAPHAQGISPRTVDWDKQLNWEDVNEGDPVPPVIFCITVLRLVVFAGAGRDFNPLHHNTPVAQQGGAPDMFANNSFVQGMWERTVREYIGLQGRYKKVGPFRMRIFNTAGETVVTRGTVKRKWVEEGEHRVELEMVCENSRGISVGPGPVLVTLPSRA